MNYTINEIPNEATEAGNGDFGVLWQDNKTKKISILNLFKNLVKKSEVTNTVSATSNNVITSKGVSSLLTIPASNTTITNAPPLQNNATYRFFFTEQITGSDDTSAMSISYNGTSYSVKATSNGSLKDFTAYPIATEQTRNLAKGGKTEEEKGETKVEIKGETKSGTRATVTTYVYCQAYTTLEMMFDGTQFIIMGNPVVISNSDYTVYTDGSITYTDKGIINKTVNKWSATTGSYILKKFVDALNIPRNKWVVFRITAFDMNSLSDNFCYYGIAYHNYDGTMQNISVIKETGTASIINTNVEGSIVTTIENGSPTFTLELVHNFS